MGTDKMIHWHRRAFIVDEYLFNSVGHFECYTTADLRSGLDGYCIKII